ncbi:MAG: hypothetical protein ACXVB9_04545 [Bdellovibrionota bacterium]
MKTYRLIFLALAFFSSAARADKNPALIDVQNGVSRPAPADLNLATYMAWAAPILKGADAVSAFTPKVFEWYQNEKDRGLPQEVYNDPQRIYVNVQRPLAETQALEDSGDITEGNTVGAEVYAEETGTVSQALTAMLFRWGKPAGAADGHTYPPGGPFSKRVDYFAANPDWGPQAYSSLSMRRDGGILQNISDRYLVLIRGDATKGYDVLMQYVKPSVETPTEKCFAIAIIRPLGNGKTSYKISTRYQGQVYKILGSIKIGRDQIGFNVQKVRGVQVETAAMLKEFQDTGTIKDHKTDIEFGH